MKGVIRKLWISKEEDGRHILGENLQIVDLPIRIVVVCRVVH